jgi:hypothetical protein
LLGFFRFALGLVRVNSGRCQRFAGWINHGHLAAGAETGVNG